MSAHSVTHPDTKRPQGSQPNILFIQTDQLTIDVLAAYGNPICKTPNLDALAEAGTVFERTYCNYPLCAPSRFSMAAGLLASRIGAYDNAAEFPASIPTYAHYLRALGYRTCLSGKMHFVGPDQLHGFERRLTSDIYPGDFNWTADWEATSFDGATDIRMLTASGVCARSVQIDYDEDVTYKAIQEIYDCARDPSERPFFLQVSYTHPHDPYLALRKHWELYSEEDIPAPRTPRPDEADNDPHSLRVLRQHGLFDAEISDEVIQLARRAYSGSVSYIDDNIGKLRDALTASGQADNTIIVFSSDHGEMLGERGLWLKKTFFEPATRVPLIILAPQHLRSGRVETLCSLVDLLPTFAEFASDGQWTGAIEPLDGQPLSTVADNPNPDRTILGELLCEGISAPIFMVRQGDHKLISGGNDPDMLFNVATDPDEQHNLASHPALAATRQALRGIVDETWDVPPLSADIRRSQQRRLLIHRAHKLGTAPSWDHPDGTHSDRWFRGAENYNDWAFEYLPDADAASD